MSSSLLRDEIKNSSHLDKQILESFKLGISILTKKFIASITYIKSFSDFKMDFYYTSIFENSF